MGDSRHSTPADVLREHLELLKRKNPRFSMRAFARLLSLSPSHLSQILSGKKKFSAENAKTVAEKLKFSTHYQKYFLLLVELETASMDAKPLLRRKADALLASIHSNRTEPKEKLSRLKWEHLLLLVSLELHPIITEEHLSSFAKFSGLKKDELKILIKELLQADLIKKTQKGYERTKQQLLLTTDGDTSPLTKIHKAYVSRIREHLENRAPQYRFSATEFYAVPRDKLPLVRERAEEFLDEIASFSNSSEVDEVVEIALHLNSFSRTEVLGD